MGNKNLVFIVYSDGKIILEIDLNSGTYSLPNKIITKFSEENIKLCAEKTLGISIDGFEKLKEDETSLLIIVGEWEGNIRLVEAGRRLIWKKIKEGIDEIENKSHVESLTFFQNTYRQVLSPSGRGIGIASEKECSKYNLPTKLAIALLADSKGNLLLEEKKGVYHSLFTDLLLGEKPEEAIYRHLRDNHEIVLELKQINEFQSEIDGRKRNISIIGGNPEESLTFLNKPLKRTIKVPSDKLVKMALNGDEGLSTMLSEALKRGLGAI